MPYTFTINIVGTPEPADKRAALQQCRERNARLVAAGRNPLPLGTNPEIKTAYEAYLTEVITNAHASYAASAERQGSLQTIFTDESQLKELRRSVIDLFNSGLSTDQILAKLK